MTRATTSASARMTTRLRNIASEIRSTRRMTQPPSTSPDSARAVLRSRQIFNLALLSEIPLYPYPYRIHTCRAAAIDCGLQHRILRHLFRRDAPKHDLDALDPRGFTHRPVAQIDEALLRRALCIITREV